MSRPVAFLIAAATLAAAVAGLIVSIVSAGRGVAQWDVVPFAVAVGAPALVGLFVALRLPRNPVPWILLVGGLCVAVVIAAGAVAELALHEDADSTVGQWAGLVSQQWPVLFIWPLALAYVFPDGRLPSRRWRPMAAVATVASAGLALLLALGPEIEVAGRTLASPSPLTVPKSLEPVFWICWVGLLVSLFGAAAR